MGGSATSDGVLWAVLTRPVAIPPCGRPSNFTGTTQRPAQWSPPRYFRRQRVPLPRPCTIGVPSCAAGGPSLPLPNIFSAPGSLSSGRSRYLYIPPTWPAPLCTRLQLPQTREEEPPPPPPVLVIKDEDGNDTTRLFPVCPRRPPIFPASSPFQHSNARLDKPPLVNSEPPLDTSQEGASRESLSFGIPFGYMRTSARVTGTLNTSTAVDAAASRRVEARPPRPHTTRSRFRTHAVSTIAEGKAEGR